MCLNNSGFGAGVYKWHIIDISHMFSMPLRVGKINTIVAKCCRTSSAINDNSFMSAAS